jgi:hypothetical protein
MGQLCTNKTEEGEEADFLFPKLMIIFSVTFFIEYPISASDFASLAQSVLPVGSQVKFKHSKDVC